MIDHISEKLRKIYPTLTKSQKAVANFVLSEPKLIALHSARRIGELTSTSETTVIRFCYSLGYSGYTLLQKDIRESFLYQQLASNAIKTYSDATANLVHESNAVQRVMEQDISYIQQLLNDVNHRVYARAIDAILQAKHIVVVGFRSSYAPANWLSFTLNIIRGNTHLYRGAIDDANRFFIEMNSDWLVIALSFPRYAEETVSFASAAKECGAKVLAITDDELSPIGPEADIVIKVVTPPPAALKGMSTIFSLLNGLVTGVAAADWENVEERVRKYDGTGLQFYPFAMDGRATQVDDVD